MYAKPSFRSSEDVNIPENYRGNAFREIAREEQQPEKEESVEVADAAKSVSDIQGEVSLETPRKPQHQSPLLAAIMPPKVSRQNGLLSNVGIEELLIFGILLLLSQGDADDDILLLLFLLLFYK